MIGCQPAHEPEPGALGTSLQDLPGRGDPRGEILLYHDAQAGRLAPAPMVFRRAQRRAEEGLADPIHESASLTVPSVGCLPTAERDSPARPEPCAGLADKPDLVLEVLEALHDPDDIEPRLGNRQTMGIRTYHRRDGG